MSITRRGLADEIDRLDDEIVELQKDKAEIFRAYREQLGEQDADKAEIKAEVATLKLAIRRRRELAQDPNAVAEKDARLDKILDEIARPAKSGTLRATRTRAHARDNDEPQRGGSAPPDSAPPQSQPTPAAASAAASTLTPPVSSAGGQGTASPLRAPALPPVSEDVGLTIPPFLLIGHPECVRGTRAAG